MTFRGPQTLCKAKGPETQTEWKSESVFNQMDGCLFKTTWIGGPNNATNGWVMGGPAIPTYRRNLPG